MSDDFREPNEPTIEQELAYFKAEVARLQESLDTLRQHLKTSEQAGDQWQTCAERLAMCVRNTVHAQNGIVWPPEEDALAEFDRLKGKEGA